ncbi:serine/threonine protein kinase ATM, partial [Trifolium medium]|nr:serine/threonine protein kinase ATM [Trifolium medium]
VCGNAELNDDVGFDGSIVEDKDVNPTIGFEGSRVAPSLEGKSENGIVELGGSDVTLKTSDEQRKEVN